ncbi:MAG: choice-of-anchor P family protein [Thermoanaerobaculia bacterium]
MSRSSRTGLCRIVGVVALAVASLGAAAHARSQKGSAGPVPENLQYLYYGKSYGASVTVGSTVLVSETALAAIGCGAGNSTNTEAGISHAPLVSTGTIDTVATGTTGPVRSTHAESTVQNVSLLEGLVTAATVHAESQVSWDGFSFSGSGDGSSLADLRVAGLPVLIQIKPNTTLALAGIGTLILNEQIVDIQAGRARVTTNMIHLVVELPNPLADVGTEIVVASSHSALRQGSGLLKGYAFAARTVTPPLDSGQFGLKILPCDGTGSQWLSAAAPSIDVPGVLTSGTASSGVWGDVGQNRGYARTRNTLQGVNLLGGLLQADVITADVNVTIDGPGVETFGDNGSGFVGLSLAGHPAIQDDVPDNTAIFLDGLGVLFLNRTVPGDRSISKRMVELFVTLDNVLGLPVGSWVVVGKADVGVLSEEEAAGGMPFMQ